MNEEIAMYYVLITIVLLCGYLRILMKVQENTLSKEKVHSISIILIIFYCLITFPFLIVVRKIIDPQRIAILFVGLSSLTGIVVWLYKVAKNYKETNKTMLVAFFVYMLMVGYVTIFSRDTSFRSDVVLDLGSIRKVIHTHSFDDITHMLLNIVMFIPLGFLLPCINREQFGSFIYSLVFALMLSAFIETTQMAFQIGLCDFEDLVANTFGAILGWAAFQVFRKYRKS